MIKDYVSLIHTEDDKNMSATEKLKTLEYYASELKWSMPRSLQKKLGIEDKLEKIKTDYWVAFVNWWFR